MIITRHNYEEFFLLYVDKELDPEGYQAVEKFVSQNPDLGEELEMLKQATLVNDMTSFKNKEVLYKKETGICLANFQEYFLLYVDNELNEQEIEEVGNFVLKHPEVQKEFTLLQKTRLQPPSISFTGKEKLYRKEKGVRIIPHTLVRLGAAAAIVGVVYISFVAVVKNRSGNRTDIVTTVPKPAATGEKNDKLVTQAPVTEKSGVSGKDSVANKLKVADNFGLAVTNKKQKSKVVVKSARSVIEKVAVNKVKNNNQLSIAKQNVDIEHKEIGIQTDSQRKIGTPDVSTGLNNTLKTMEDDEKTVLAVNERFVKEEPLLVSHPVYLETDNVDEDKTLYIGSAEINKNKLKGLFKKATTLFEKKIRHNED